MVELDQYSMSSLEPRANFWYRLGTISWRAQRWLQWRPGGLGQTIAAKLLPARSLRETGGKYPNRPATQNE